MKTVYGKPRRTAWIFVPLGLICIAAVGQARQSTPTAQDEYIRLIGSVKGPDLYRAYCASCHGLDGRGGGPIAGELKARVPDLTLLAANHAGQFPAMSVRQTIVGDSNIGAHGPREMPIWGPIFHQIEADMDWGNVRVENLVNYLRSIQTIVSTEAPTGAELYQQNCAACHGADLKGNRSAPPPFGVVPDLTRLAQRNGRVFPTNYVSNVLRHGVKMSGHGPAEMPIWGTDFELGDQLSAAQVTQRIAELTNYIKSRQAK